MLDRLLQNQQGGPESCAQAQEGDGFCGREVGFPDETVKRCVGCVPQGQGRIDLWSQIRRARGITESCVQQLESFLDHGLGFFDCVCGVRLDIRG